MPDNKLYLEKSLYLKQHAENPIHWWSWGAEALNYARDNNKLVFLSIGYSSCHWCHVMAHESFEDQATADYLNKNFVSIKVDREEHPDVDHYYQSVCTVMTGRGGWPLTVFLTPEGKAFFAGTYFPKVARQGMPSFMELLAHITDLYKKSPEDVRKNGEDIAAKVRETVKLENKIDFQGHFPPPSAIMNALSNYADKTNGGYGQAPKFPHFSFLEWASEQILEGMIPQDQGLHIVETVEKMLMGGLYDHVKGGIHRYSVDEKFMVPHFEKMLYDQAGLLKLLSKVTQFYPSPLMYDALIQTMDYLESEMQDEKGFFFSAQDADSEGQEGLYFTFSQEEFLMALEEANEKVKNKKDYFLKVFNITEKGNFEQGLNVISLNPELKTEFYTPEGWDEIREVRRVLLEQRKMRIPPATDRKGIAGWNWMIMAALADIVQYCSVTPIKEQAFRMIQNSVEGCLKEFLGTNEASGRHYLTHVNTIASQTLYLEDYTNFADAQIRLFEVTGNPVFKTNALESADFILKNFIKDKKIYQVSLNDASNNIENLQAPFYDQSYRSSAMTLIQVLNRLKVHRAELAPAEIFGEEFEMFAQYTLSNPLGHGEGLRALTYPTMIFRKIEVPQAWLGNADFIELRSHFFNRFVMDYHTRDQDSWQICHATACEAQGKGLSDFQSLFIAPEAQENNAQ